MVTNLKTENDTGTDTGTDTASDTGTDTGTDTELIQTLILMPSEARGNAHASRATTDRRPPGDRVISDSPTRHSPPTRMVGAGNVHSLLWTFLRLRNTCKLASMNIHSDSYGDLTATVRMTITGQAERGPGTQAPSPVAPSAPTTPTPTPTPAPAPAPAPARRARRRGPGALL